MALWTRTPTPSPTRRTRPGAHPSLLRMRHHARVNFTRRWTKSRLAIAPSGPGRPARMGRPGAFGARGPSPPADGWSAPAVSESGLLAHLARGPLSSDALRTPLADKHHATRTNRGAGLSTASIEWALG